MRYVKVLQADSLQDGEKIKVTPGDKALLVTRVQGAYYAIDNRCPHMGGSLYDGRLEGDTVLCPKHGTAFNVRTGKVTRNGRIAFISLKVSDVKAYPVKIENGDLLVGLD
ncbi:MAG: Rieske 2Fe-2S domain-containing protein [Eubacteriales bacterium]|nr:Rieske 2Fe-2S domain-containing protein [Eubacteriales bacterium]